VCEEKSSFCLVLAFLHEAKKIASLKKMPGTHAMIRDEEERAFGDLGDQGERRARLLGTSTLGPAIKNDEEVKDVFFAALFVLSILVVVLLGLINGIQALTLGVPDKYIINPIDSSASVIRNEQQFSRGALFGGVLLICAGSCALSIGAVSLLCRYSKQIVVFCVGSTVMTFVVSGLSCLGYGSIALGVVLLLLSALTWLIYYFFLRQRINLASTMLYLASQAISHTTLFFFVTLLLTAQLVFAVLWFLAVIGGATNEAESHEGCVTFEFSAPGYAVSGTYVSCPGPGSCQACVCQSTRVVSTNSPCYAPRLLPSQLFGLLLLLMWVSNTCSGVVHVGISKATAAWWTRSEGASEVAMAVGFRKALTTNFGSIALGSLLVSTIQLARTVCEFTSRTLGSCGSVTGSGSGRCSPVRAFAISCVDAALSTLERAATYFSKYALCYVAIFDLPFIDASKAVVGLFHHRGWTSIVNDSIMDIVLAFAHTGVGVAVVLISLLYTHSLSLNSTDTLMLCIAGFFVGCGFCSIATRALSSSANTIFVCFAENPDAFSDSHPAENLLLVAAWRELHGQQSEDDQGGGSNGNSQSLDDETAAAADVLSPHFVRKYAPPAAVAAACIEEDGDDGDDEHQGPVLDLVSPVHRGSGSKK